MLNNESDTILLVEDNEDDQFALKRALRKAGIGNPLHIAADGRQAVEYLADCGKTAGPDHNAIPCLVLLDLKLPYMDGFEVLQWIREQSGLTELPVAILSGSNEPQDRDKANELGAATYLVKPATPEALAELISSVCA